MNARYIEYLQSPEWREKREKVIQRDESYCQICRTETAEPEVHHLTYARIFRESLRDLITLCSSCHSYLSRWHKITGIRPHVLPTWLAMRDELAAFDNDEFYWNEYRPKYIDDWGRMFGAEARTALDLGKAPYDAVRYSPKFKR